MPPAIATMSCTDLVTELCSSPRFRCVHAWLEILPVSEMPGHFSIKVAVHCGRKASFSGNEFDVFLVQSIVDSRLELAHLPHTPDQGAIQLRISRDILEGPAVYKFQSIVQH